MIIYRIKIAYDGTEFCGWQIQPNALSIQEEIEKALLTTTREKVRIIGAGRTDAGVHARGQVAHFRLETACDLIRLQRSLNGLLPPSIRILSLDTPKSTFHAQRSAVSKEYHYHLCLDEIVLPFDRPYVWHFRRPLDLNLLRDAAQEFIGKRNFHAFSNERGHGIRPKTYVRNLFRLDVIRTQIGIRLEFEGDGFLYKMVRNITGMLVQVASHKRPIEEIAHVFASEDRRKAARAAPAQGLCLIRVQY